MEGQPPRLDIGKQNTWQSGLQFQWWVYLSILATESGYRKIRQIYRDRKAADISMIEDCIRRILPPKYYKIDLEQINRKVNMIYGIIGQISSVETLSVPPELTSDHENCRLNLSERSGRPRMSTLQMNEDNLFFDHIYSTLYDAVPKRFLTSFAITRNLFHNFFGIAEDDLDQHTSFLLPRDDYQQGRDNGEGIEEF
jgi:hypothetical protein